MTIVGGLDVHRQQITFDYVDTASGEVCCGQISAADRRRLAAWLERFADRDDDERSWSSRWRGALAGVT